MKIKIDVFDKKDNRHGITISKKTKDGWGISYVGDWEGDFGTKDVFKLKGNYSSIGLWKRFTNWIKRR